MPRVVPPLGAGLIRLVKTTMRIRHVNRPCWDDYRKDPEGIIYAFWHNRLFLMPYIARSKNVAVLISQHRDGEIISRTMSYFGFTSVRGSTTRGGRRALRIMPKLLREGHDLAITPDGPRGPVYQLQPGVIMVARLSGRPVFPVAFSSDRFHSFRSWDTFQVPKLFSRGVFLWGDPFTVDRRDDIEEKRRELEDAMMALTRRADAWFKDAAERVPVTE